METGALFKQAMDFIERRDQCATLEQLNDSFGQLISQHGVETFVSSELASPQVKKPIGLIFGRPDDGFLRDYIQTQSFRRDPMIREAFMTTKPFAWSDVLGRGDLTPEAQSVMSLARDWSKTAGYVVPIHKPNAPINTVVMAGRKLDANPALRPFLHLLAIYYNETGRRLALREQARADSHHKLLNDLELECLRAAAVGRTDWEIGQSMSLRESEVRAMIEQAQRKLGVSSRIQAIIAALQRKELAF